MFGQLFSKQAQVTGGGAMPSGTLESPLFISRVRALASKSTLHEEAENTGFWKLLYSDVWINSFSSSACPSCHTLTVFLLIRDSDSPTHELIESHPSSAVNVLLTWKI